MGGSRYLFVEFIDEEVNESLNEWVGEQGSSYILHSSIKANASKTLVCLHLCWVISILVDKYLQIFTEHLLCPTE